MKRAVWKLSDFGIAAVRTGMDYPARRRADLCYRIQTWTDTASDDVLHNPLYCESPVPGLGTARCVQRYVL